MHKCARDECKVVCPNKWKHCPGCRKSKSTTPITNDKAARTWSETSDTADVGVTTAEKVTTLADLIRVCAIDTAIWEVDRWVANTWGNEQHFQVKAWLKRKTVVLAIQNEIADLIASTKTALHSWSPAPKMELSPPSDLLLEVSIPDLHAGKLAWGKETGDANYDTTIARALFEQALETLVSRTSGLPISQILFPIGNDLLNADNAQGTTTAGTPQTTDGRYQKTFRTVRFMMVEAIERLRLIAPVKVIPVPGNHDQLATWHLGDSLECYFHNYPDVTIDNAPRTRKYHQWGHVMLMFTHGDKGKKTNYPLLMASEQPQMWSETRYREAHTGHLHKTATELDEFNGVRVRISPALCSADAWHAEQGYVGQQRGAEAFLWDRTEGLVNMAFFTVGE